MEKFQLIFFFKRGRLNVSGPVKCSFQGERKKKKEGGGKKKNHKAWGGDEVARPQQFFQFQCTPNSVSGRMHTGRDLWENCPATKEGELRLL